MNDFMNSWIYTLLISGCICSIFLYLCPESKMKKILETGTICVILISLLSAAKQLNNKMYLTAFEEYRQKIAIQETQITASAEELSRKIIEEQYSAYIFSKASAENVYVDSVSVETMKNDQGEWIPCKVTYFSNEEIPHTFKEQISIDFGISKERQFTYESK